MADRVEADAALFRQAALKTGHVRDRVNGVLDTLQTSLAGRGTPWGDDKIGKQFADGPDGYLVALTKLTTGTTNMALTFGNFSDGQIQSADLLQSMDHNGFPRHHG